MKYEKIDNNIFLKMLENATHNLVNNSAVVDELNVFPVPDGDTGINMSLTITSGLKEVTVNPNKSVGVMAKNFSRGLLMGARGNSGVILSQLFRGFASVLELHETVNVETFISALKKGYEIAYKAVMKPTEGTILTVSREAAEYVVENKDNYNDMFEVLKSLYDRSRSSLENTPNLLPILKEANVVDSGGMGLVFIYEGFYKALIGETIVLNDTAKKDTKVQSILKIDTESINFSYCTEFLLELKKEKLRLAPFKEDRLKRILSKFGDSIVVVCDNDIVKVHIHTNEPGVVLNKAQKYGEFKNVKIENMVLQHTEIINTKMDVSSQDLVHKEKQEYALLSVVAGEGLVNLFKEIGCEYIIEGGQTMNPSTEDFIKLINETNAKNVFIFPNNSNIILAANQAAKLVDDCNVVVIPTKTIGEGYSAALLFDESLGVKENVDSMDNAISEVKSGSITYAVRDTKIGDVEIKKDNYIAILEKGIVDAGVDKLNIIKKLINKIVSDTDEILTLFYGEDTSENEVEELISYISKEKKHIEIEKYYGGQPIYSYLFAVQ